MGSRVTCDGNLDILIPGLPDDIAILCLIRLGRKYHSILRCVCRSWRSFISSDLFISLRAKFGLSEGWIYVFSRDNSEHVHWHVLDPCEQKWMTLPAVPAVFSKRFGMSCTVLDDKFYVIGGCGKYGNETNEAYVFDACQNEWKMIPSMESARCFLVTGSLNGKVYAIGGTGKKSRDLTSWEMYDPSTDKWESNEDRNIVQDVGESLVMDEKIFIRHVSPPYGSPHYASRYDPNTKRWSLVDDDMTRRWHGPAIVVGKETYVLDQTFGIKLLVLDKKKMCWELVGRISTRSIETPCRMATVGSTLFIVGSGLKTLVLDTERTQRATGILITSSIVGPKTLSDNVVMSCNTIYI